MRHPRGTTRRAPLHFHAWPLAFLGTLSAHDSGSVPPACLCAHIACAEGLLDTIGMDTAFADPDGQDKQIALQSLQNAVNASSVLNTPIKRISAELSVHSQPPPQTQPHPQPHPLQQASVPVAGPSAASAAARGTGKRARRLTFKSTQTKAAARTAPRCVRACSSVCCSALPARRSSARASPAVCLTSCAAGLPPARCPHAN